MRLLLEAGADKEAKGYGGNTPRWRRRRKATRRLRLRRMEEFSRRHAFRWAYNGHEARALLAGADKDRICRRPLIKAAENGHEAIVRLLGQGREG